MNVKAILAGVLLAALGATAPALAAEGPAPQTVYLNYEGGRLHPGEDSGLDQLRCITGPLNYPAQQGTRETTEQVTELVRSILSPFAVRVVDERPPVYLAHTMVMVGGTPDPLGLDPGVGGYACEIDCADVLSRETVLVFGDGRTPQEIAQTIVHEVGHSWGLDHVEDLDLIMNGTTSGSDRTFSDGCTALEDPGSSECAQWHAEFCDEPGTQDTIAEVMAVRGPAFVDLQLPRIEIAAPNDGAEVWPGEHVRIEVDVEDDHPGVGWQLVVPELEWSERSDDGTFDLQFPEGRYTLRVEAMDQAGNEAAEEVTLRVGEPEGQDESEDEPVEGEDEPAAPPDHTSDEASGCRIGSGPAAPTWMLLLLLMLPLWRRPRR